MASGTVSPSVNYALTVSRRSSGLGYLPRWPHFGRTLCARCRIEPFLDQAAPLRGAGSGAPRAVPGEDGTTDLADLTVAPQLARLVVLLAPDAASQPSERLHSCFRAPATRSGSAWCDVFR